MKFLFLVPAIFLTLLAPFFTSCGSQYGAKSFAESPQIINVSEWDPKERQRAGSSYSPSNQRALKANGAHGLIARCAKGTINDNKCAAFLAGAERQGLLLGSYYYIQPNRSASSQASHFLRRLKEIKSSRNLHTSKILLAADFDTKCSAALMANFVEEIHRRTGVYPIVYLENSEQIRRALRNATSSQKASLRRCPYWLALYSDTYPGIPTPKKLAQASGVWNDWALWQYAGVFWEGGRSKIHNYSAGSWKTPKYFGNLDRPTERNGFNGTTAQLHSFWNKHSWKW